VAREKVKHRPVWARDAFEWAAPLGGFHQPLEVLGCKNSPLPTYVDALIHHAQMGERVVWGAAATGKPTAETFHRDEMAVTSPRRESCLTLLTQPLLNRRAREVVDAGEATISQHGLDDANRRDYVPCGIALTKQKPLVVFQVSGDRPLAMFSVAVDQPDRLLSGPSFELRGFLLRGFLVRESLHPPLDPISVAIFNIPTTEFPFNPSPRL
jgi:hypothetical protein